MLKIKPEGNIQIIKPDLCTEITNPALFKPTPRGVTQWKHDSWQTSKTNSHQSMTVNLHVSFAAKQYDSPKASLTQNPKGVGH